MLLKVIPFGLGKVFFLEKNEHCPNKLVWQELGEEELKRLEFLLSTRSKKRSRSHRIPKSQ